MENFILKEGFRSGKLQAIKETVERRNGNVMWECVCDCGKIILVRATAIRTKRNKSCGCDIAIVNSKRETTHGQSRGKNNSLYLIWQGIKTRCLNKNSFAYKDYGGRGIKICDEWKDNFEKFRNDMSDGYAKGLTIERKEVNGNYEKSNCIWITRAEQANNRRTTIYLETEKYGKITIKDAAKIVGIGWQGMYVRVKNWPKERWFEPK